MTVNHSAGDFQYGIKTGTNATCDFVLAGTAGKRGPLTVSIYNNSGNTRDFIFTSGGVTLATETLSDLSTVMATFMWNGAMWVFTGSLKRGGDLRGN